MAESVDVIQDIDKAGGLQGLLNGTVDTIGSMGCGLECELGFRALLTISVLRIPRTHVSTGTCTGVPFEWWPNLPEEYYELRFADRHAGRGLR